MNFFSGFIGGGGGGGGGGFLGTLLYNLYESYESNTLGYHYNYSHHLTGVAENSIVRVEKILCSICARSIFDESA